MVLPRGNGKHRHRYSTLLSSSQIGSLLPQKDGSTNTKGSSNIEDDELFQPPSIIKFLFEKETSDKETTDHQENGMSYTASDNKEDTSWFGWPAPGLTSVRKSPALSSPSAPGSPRSLNRGNTPSVVPPQLGNLATRSEASREGYLGLPKSLTFLPDSPPIYPSQETPKLPDNGRFSQLQSLQEQKLFQRNKAYATCLRYAERTESALTRFLANYPDHARTKEELKEYRACRAKLNDGILLSAPERGRLGQIARNIERREYAISKNIMPITRKKFSSQIPPAEHNARNTVEEVALSNPNSKESSSFNMAVEECKCPTARERERMAVPQSCDQTDEVSEVELEEEEEEDAEYFEEDCDGSDTGSQDALFWHYHVYIFDSSSSAGTTFISTFISKNRAEDCLRSEIAKIYTSCKLEDRSGLEMKCNFGDGGIREQSLEFSSGRFVQVRIERELVKEAIVPKQRRRKLQYLPNKIYIVTEHISVVDPENMEGKNQEIEYYAQFPRQTHGKEGFILLKHANEQANREMMTYLTNHLTKAQKFDPSFTGTMDTEAKLYLHELEEGERSYDRKSIVTDKNGYRLQVRIRVMEILVRGPRN
ncbi:hypothetical protein LOZ53_000359 [Ophidiomyces ophidiicola]|nr:hypothetical protein LOZ55_006377 [Ophidiomyces ophidiicola]KAI1978581.1 hypothetical protein LOZ54_006267 [Ophidiomyces ophidiicola]KAI1997746.1 hypothetical protein LOZ53_000359 [Ophidiomyces ophidiicola]KAI1999637.1 hypothetical protein LOZ51_002131 [Ophidiomyces ophidiicola]